MDLEIKQEACYSAGGTSIEILYPYIAKVYCLDSGFTLKLYFGDSSR